MFYTFAMKKYTVIARPDPESERLKKELIQRLNGKDHVLDEEHPEIVFVVGGDGTFLYAIHYYLEQLDHVQFYGIHTGTLGFYTDYHDGEFKLFLNAYLNGSCWEKDYPMLRADTDLGTYYGVNEIRVENAARTQDMNVIINGRKFEEFRGTGLCISTQLGSTAYNRSLGGAVIQDGLDLIQMSEIGGIHHNKYRSLGASFVMKRETEIRLESHSFTGALLGADSEVFSMDAMHEVKIAVSDHKKVRMLKSRDISYFDRLQSLF